MLNPYAGALGTNDPLEVIRATSGALSALTTTLGPRGLATGRGPGTWTATEIICHLADCELVFGFRLRQALTEPHHVIQPFDQNLWASVTPYAGALDALEAFAAVRAGNLRLIQALTAEALDKPVTHPERGTMTVSDVVATMAGHDLNHLGQLREIEERLA